MLDSTTFILLFTILAYLFVGIIVIANDPKAAANRILFIITLLAGFWAISFFFINIQVDIYLTLFWIRVSHAVGAVAPWHMLALVTSLFEKNPLSSWRVRVTLAISLLMVGVAFSPNFIIGLEEPYFENRIIYGSYTYPFILFLIVMTGFTLWQVFKRMKNSRGKKRIQMNYLFNGTLISAFIITTVNIVLPLLGIIYIYGLDIRSLGPLSSLIMLGSISYAIIRHRFMDIRLALRKNLTTLITAFLLAIISIFIVRITFQWDTVDDTLIKEIILAIILFLVLMILPSIKEQVQFLIDRYLYKGKADYHTLIINSIKELSNRMDVELFIAILIENIVSFMKLEYAFYCLKDFREDYNFKGFAGKTEEFNAALIDNNIFKMVADYIEEENIVTLQADVLSRIGNPASESLYLHLKDMGVDIVMPLVNDACLEGLLFLGSKDNGEAYYHEDIILLSEIYTQVKIFLINANHYKEIINIRNYQERILSEMGNGLIAVNNEGYITNYNSEAENIFGISKNDVLGKELITTLGEDLYKIYEATLLKNFNLSQHEISIFSKGKTQFVSCNSTLIQDSDTGIIEVIIIISNITRIKELENERIKSQRLISLGEMAAGIAHEIKNPLVSIKTFADLLPEKYEDYDFRVNFSNVVSQEITRINKLVGELLNFVKEPILNYEQVYLESLIEEVVSLLSPQMIAQQVLLKLELPELLEPVIADSTLLKQAILNLCLNSVQAMPDGGNLVVGIRTSDTDLTIYVEDTGLGIRATIRDKIFNPFFTSKADGVGLGLSICHKIISSHGGRIIVKSDEGIGSRFEIVLPRN